MRSLEVGKRLFCGCPVEFEGLRRLESDFSDDVQCNLGGLGMYRFGGERLF